MNKVAVITGGARMIERAPAIKLEKRGFDILIHRGGKSIEEAKKTAELVQQLSKKCEIVTGDLSDLKTIELIKDKANSMGDVLILINNAGMRIHEVFEKIKYEDWKKIMTINVDAAFLCAQALIGSMTKNSWGRIVNIGGMSGHIGARERAHVVTSKAALVGLTRAISMEFIERGITCNCVVPGFIEDFDTDKKELRGHWLKHPQTPNLSSGRYGNPDDVAEVISNLCKEEAGYINGQVLHVNGGTYTP